MADGTAGGLRPPSDLPSADEPHPDRTRLVGQEGPEGLPRVYVTREALEFVHRCARLALRDQATGGLLMGQAYRSPDGRRFVIVDGVIEAPEVEAVARSVKFTPRTWRSLRAAASAHFAGRSAVGWFHARPEEPPDLSAYEAFVHQTHFGAPWQVALVVDPVGGRTTFWGWNGEELEKIPGFRIHDGPTAGLLTGEDLRRAGWAEGATEAAASSDSPDAYPDRWRGTWAVGPVQERVRARREARSRSPWQRVARALGALTLLVVVFVAAMMARWAVERPWRMQPQGSVPQAIPGADDPLASSGYGTAGIGSRGAGTGATDVMGGGPAFPARPDASRLTPGPPVPVAGLAVGPREQPQGSAGQAPASPGAGEPEPGEAGAPGPRPPEVYVVRAGDTLWKISERFYGDPRRYRWLADHNGLRDPGHIVVGQPLKLPAAGELPPARK